MTGSRNPFASPLFARWWIASFVAGTGVGVQSVAVPIFIRDRTEGDLRAVAIAAALIAQTLPAALLSLVGGSVADRTEHRRILGRSYAVAAIVACGYVVLSGLDIRVIWPVFPLAATVGAAAAFTNPARTSMLPLLVTRTQLQNGVIIGNMGFMATLQFVGPSVGGIVADARDLTSAFGLEAFLIAAAALLFSQIRTGAPAPRGGTVMSDLREGLRYALREPTLLGLFLLSVVPGIFFIGPFAVTVPLMVPDVFHASDRWVGFLWGCFGIGVLGGSGLLTVRPLRPRGLAVCISTFAGGVLLTLYGSSESLGFSAAVLVAWGFGASVFMNYAVALLQENAAPEMMGRVMSMHSLVFFASSPIGYAQAGTLTSLFGMQAALVGNGIVAAGIGLCAVFFLRSVRRLD